MIDVVDASPPREAVAPAVKSAARWFMGIASLSLLSILMSSFGLETTFFLGLGFANVSEALTEHSKVYFFIVAITLTFFFFIGWQAMRGKQWAFYLGISVYSFDAVMYAIANDWMSVAFHALAIFFLAVGASQLTARHGEGTA